MSSTFSRLRATRSSPVKAVMAIGVVWMFSSRKRAVTTTSSMPARSWLLGLSCTARGVLVRQPTAAARVESRSICALRVFEETQEDGDDRRRLANPDSSRPEERCVRRRLVIADGRQSQERNGVNEYVVCESIGRFAHVALGSHRE